jgi:2'-5' RNA ligase
VTLTRRLGVALLLDPPVADAVDGLRRALGDPSLGRVGPHLTLVPPVNVPAGQLGTALGRVRSAAGRSAGPLRLTLGPPATFLPDNPVLYLRVGGDLEALRSLRDAVFQPPLARTLSWSWVPHVTLADNAEEARIAAAIEALDRFATVTSFDRVVLLAEARGRIWRPIADAALRAPAVVGTGGLAVEITRGRVLDPEIRQLIEEAGVVSDLGEVAAACPTGLRLAPIVLSGRREGKAVGTAVAWRADDGGHAAVIVDPAVRRQGIGGTLLAHLEAAVRQAGWDCPVLHAHGPAGFYRARSGWAEPGPPTRTSPRSTGPAS